MNDIISKELLSEVLNIPLKEIEKIETHNNCLYINSYPDRGLQSNYDIYNIYELANKCKEWAFELKEIVISFKYRYNENKIIWIAETNKCRFRSNTEPESIFKACQYILDNKDK